MDKKLWKQKRKKERISYTAALLYICNPDFWTTDLDTDRLHGGHFNTDVTIHPDMTYKVNGALKINSLYHAFLLQNINFIPR